MSRVDAPCRVTEETLASLQGEWEGLLAQINRRWPFLQPAWQQVWWQDRPPDARPLLLSIREGEQLIGIAPLLARAEELALAGDSEICDYMDLICLPGTETRVIEAILAKLSTHPWRRFLFWGIRSDSATLPALKEVAAKHHLDLTIECEAVCPRVALPPTWDAYLDGLTKKDRHELRRKIRRFSETAGELREYALSSPAEVDAALGDFFRLHTISRHDKAEFMTASMEQFFRDMAVTLAALDLIRLYFLECGGKRVASVLAFNCGDELWLYNSGFDPAFASVSVGLVSKALALRQAIAEGKRCYDFLRGAESYKYDLGAHNLDVLRCTLHRDSGQEP